VNAAAAAVASARVKRGQEFYDQGRFGEALREFADVLALDGANGLAREYSKLSQERIEVSLQQAYSEWQTSFDGRRFDQAASAYDRIRSSNASPVAAELATQIESAYQEILSGLVISWKAACAKGDVTGMDAIRKEAIGIAPSRPLNGSALSEMEQCTQKGCIQGDPVLAVNRLRMRVNPQIEPSLQRYVTRGIRVAIEIDVEGNVRVKQISNANDRVAEPLKSAVEQWKFFPAVIDNEPRCVETELPINLINGPRE
jgi:hypothetical protein